MERDDLEVTVMLDASAITRAVLGSLQDAAPRGAGGTVDLKALDAAAGAGAEVPRWLRGAIWAFDPAALEGLDALTERGADERIAADASRAPWVLAEFGGGARLPGQGVALVELQGFITRRPSFWASLFGGASLVEFEEALRAAARDPAVGAIVIDCDSPGGSVTGVHEAFETVREVNGQKPIHVAISGLCASAAYWLAAGASSITISPSAEVGSIGVFGVHADRSAFLASKGITISVFAVPKAKAETLDVQPLTDEARAAMRHRVEGHYARFVEDVARGRGASVDAVRNGYGGGRVVGSDDALAAGLVDAIATPQAVVERVALGLSDRARAAEIARFRSEFSAPLTA